MLKMVNLLKLMKLLAETMGSEQRAYNITAQCTWSLTMSPVELVSGFAENGTLQQLRLQRFPVWGVSWGELRKGRLFWLAALRKLSWTVNLVFELVSDKVTSISWKQQVTKVGRLFWLAARRTLSWTFVLCPCNRSSRSLNSIKMLWFDYS